MLPRSRLLALLVALQALAASLAGGDVALVQGTKSTPDAAERAAAARITRLLDRWLTELAVPHKVLPDEAVSTSALADSQVAILGYNPLLTTRERGALGVFMRRGGQLLVFYSADPDLAGMMGLRLGSYKAAPDAGHWARVRFNASAPPHLPQGIRQNSGNIRPVYPASRNARVIANWETRGGRKLRDPALVQSDRGFWMTHVLLDDGDTWRKKRMLLGLTGTIEASVWKPAATKALADASRLLGEPSYESTRLRLLAEARANGADAHVQPLLTRADTLHAELNKILAGRGYAQVTARSADLLRLLRQAYGAAQPSRGGEVRGVWDHSGLGLYPGDWDRTCRELAAAGLTDLFVNVFGAGFAHYKSSILPPSAAYRRHGDQLRACIQAAHANGLRVHAWKLCWRLEGATAPYVAKLERKGLVQQSDSGETAHWLCPSSPTNLRAEKDAVREILKTYDVDGIHLDYIRYPDGRHCYCDGCRRAFEAAHGKTIANWPRDVRTGSLAQAYADWRCTRITRLVRDLSAVIEATRPEVQLSAAVFGKYPACRASVAQDWPVWLEKGYLDFVCPMNYTDERPAFEALLASQVSRPGAAGRIVPGIGVTAAESRLSPEDVIQQVQFARHAGSAGFVLFDLNHALAEEVLPILRLGVTAPAPPAGEEGGAE